MLKPSRILMAILLATFVVGVPTAVAQSPTTDQYNVPPAGDTEPVDEGAAPIGDEGETAPEDAGAAPVAVAQRPAAGDDAGKLPFTGAQVSLIALAGLALLTLGLLGLAASRRRRDGAPA